MRLSTDEYDRLCEAGILDKVELIEGRVLMGGYELMFSAEQARAAAQLGVHVRSCADELAEPVRDD